ncbi:MAG TPA: hypothetical protein PLW72_00605 [Burkholderiaceae bacterium]|nr:hypothetical protein [Burkholderiaceae bacterium]HQR75788.1 hypothetical protein [Burkholderiaceae bacterium]
MKRSFLRYLITSSVALTVAVLAGTVHAQALRIRITNQLPPSSPMSRGLELWKDKVEKGSQGRIRVEL